MASTRDLLLTAEEVASLLRIKVPTVYDAAARGNLPVVRLWVGKKRSLIRFRREEIEQLIAGSTLPRRSG